MKVLTSLALTWVALTCLTLAAAGPTQAMDIAPVSAVIRVDWQGPQELPRQFRNHCRVENFTGRPYCSDHCGSDYQFYFCSEASFGCCHLGHGYCGFDGVLRCHP
jgi:hypothetical protein